MSSPLKISHGRQTVTFAPVAYVLAVSTKLRSVTWSLSGGCALAEHVYTFHLKRCGPERRHQTETKRQQTVHHFDGNWGS